MSNCCSHGTFLHFGLQSSHLNICYYHQDSPLRVSSSKSGFSSEGPGSGAGPWAMTDKMSGKETSIFIQKLFRAVYI